MDIERKNLEILFKEIPYSYIGLRRLPTERYNTYDYINKSIYLEYARRIFSYYSEDERVNNYLLLLEEMEECSEKNLNIFSFIYKISAQMLTLQSGEIQCRLSQMLRWRQISFQLGQEFFTCAFLAGEDIRKGNQTRFFAWQPIISSDDVRLNNILKREIAENHFHLNGSTKIFELNWICLMNHIENRGKEFKKFDIILQHDYVNETEKKSFYEMCQEAALYRVYLFAVICGNQFLAEQAKTIIMEVEREKVFLWEKLSEIQDLICLTGNLYGAVNEYEEVLDYALQRLNYDCNNNSCRLLAGERYILYIEHLHKTVELVLDIIKEMSPGTDVEMYQQLKELICVDVLKAIQLLGFNYKEAIGEPLTQICANAILSKSRKTGQSKRK